MGASGSQGSPKQNAPINPMITGTSDSQGHPEATESRTSDPAVVEYARPDLEQSVGRDQGIELQSRQSKKP